MVESTKYVWQIAKQENDDAVADQAKTTETYCRRPRSAVWRKAMLPYQQYEDGRRTRCRRSNTVAQSAKK